jgi:3',5'-cyclic AMP phosphodiesterase CpdA
MLDNVDYLGNGEYQGRFGERQLAFASEVLRQTPADRLVVAAMHIPLRTYLDPKDPTTSTSDCTAPLELLGDRPDISISGHTHTTEHHYFGGGDPGKAPHHHHILAAVSGSWWSGP